MIIKIIVLSEKRKELTQTVRSLIALTRKEEGCISCDFYQDVVNENGFILVEEWDTRENRDKHLRSDTYAVLRGTFNFLTQAPDIKFCEIS